MATDKIVTPLFRASFIHLLDPNPKQLEKKGVTVYEVTMIFEPDADLTRMKALIEEATVEKWGSKRPSFIKSPFRKGVQKSEQYPNGYDLGKYPEYTGKIITAARSYNVPPGVVDAKRQDILEKKEIYSGIWGRATVVAYGYDNEGGIGVAFGLQNFQKCMDGEPLGGTRGPAEKDFEEFQQPVGVGSHADMLDDL